MFLSNRTFANLTRLLIMVVASLVLAIPAYATERITSYAVNIKVQQNGELAITENIRVRAEGDQIKRGIFRDILTVMLDDQGRKIRGSIYDVSVKRDGVVEQYSLADIADGKRIYIGRKNVFLDKGYYVYELKYKMDRMIRFKPEHQELYLNAIAHFWAFPIDRAVVRVQLPRGTKVLNTVAYSGRYGEDKQDVNIKENAEGDIIFRATRALASYQGMTIAIAMEKGAIAPPEGWAAFYYMLSDLRGQIFPPLIAIFVLLYNVIAWARVGRDPAKGTIVPLFYPPKGFSPALVHYVHHYGWHKGGWPAYIAALISLAVKGLVVIGETDEKDTTVTITNADMPSLPPGEMHLFNWLRAKGKIVINEDIGEGLHGNQKEVLEIIEDENRRTYFNHNTGYIVFGVVFSTLAIFAMAFFEMIEFFWLPIAAALAALTMMTTAGISHLISARSLFSWAKAFVLLALIFNFTPILLTTTGIWDRLQSAWGSGDVLNAFLALRGDVALIALLSIVAVNAIFAVLMRAPTIQGRRVMDQIEGFKMYLETAEKERLNLTNEPELNKNRFEAILPYAIALGVERPWAEHFQGEMQRIAVNTDNKSNIQLDWYSNTQFSPSHLATSLSNTTSAISAAMITARPQSSSSSGFSSGGGFSGGGGGGGGGGGW